MERKKKGTLILFTDILFQCERGRRNRKRVFACKAGHMLDTWSIFWRGRRRYFAKVEEEYLRLARASLTIKQKIEWHVPSEK